jgi:branched-subunit amino acid ABC-type transport system permease component
MQQIIDEVRRSSPINSLTQPVLAGYCPPTCSSDAQEDGQEPHGARFLSGKQGFKYELKDVVGSITFPAGHTNGGTCGTLVRRRHQLHDQGAVRLPKRVRSVGLAGGESRSRARDHEEPWAAQPRDLGNGVQRHLLGDGVGARLTYQSSGIFNFAHGVAFATAASTSTRAATADGGLGWPIVPAASWRSSSSPLLGLLLDRILLRRLAVPRVRRIVGTIGLLVAFPALVLWLVRTVGSSVLELGLPTNARVPAAGVRPVPVSLWRHQWCHDQLDQLAVFLAAGAAALLLWAVLRHTRVGLEMRAGVDRRDLAGLRGVNAAKTSAVAWVLSMTLAGLGGVLIAPLFGLTDFDYTLVVLGSLAAVVAAGLRSIPLAFAAGLALGVLQNLVFGYAPGFLTDISGFLSSIPFILTVVLPSSWRSTGRAAGSVADESPPEDHRRAAYSVAPFQAIAVGALVVYGSGSRTSSGLGSSPGHRAGVVFLRSW